MHRLCRKEYRMPKNELRVPERYAIRYSHSPHGIDRTILEELGEAEAHLAEQRQDWNRLNRVFKTTSDKTIDQDMEIEGLQKQLVQVKAERDLYVQWKEATLERLQEICEENGCPGGWNRIDFLRDYLRLQKHKLSEANSIITRLSAPAPACTFLTPEDFNNIIFARKANSA